MTHASHDLTIHPQPHNVTGGASTPGDITANAGHPLVSGLGVGAMHHTFYDHTPLLVPEPSVLDSAWRGTCAINQMAGNFANAGWLAADHQIRIIESEFDELKEGIASRDEKELRDGIADLLFTVIGLAHRLGLPSIADLAEVVRSNLTKFDPTVEDAIKTHAKYQAIGVDTYRVEKFAPDNTSCFVTYSTHDQVDTAGKKYIANKWLKSYRWEDVDLEPLAADNQLLTSR